MRRFEFWVGGLGLCVVVDRALCLLSFYSFVDLIWSAKKPLVLSLKKNFRMKNLMALCPLHLMLYIVAFGNVRFALYHVR